MTEVGIIILTVHLFIYGDIWSCLCYVHGIQLFFTALPYELSGQVALNSTTEVKHSIYCRMDFKYAIIFIVFVPKTGP